MELRLRGRLGRIRIRYRPIIAAVVIGGVSTAGLAGAAGEGLTTIAGSGVNAYGGDGGPATSAALNEPADAVALGDGGYLIADSKNHRVRRVAPDGTITTVAGTGVNGYNGDDRLATDAALNEPTGVALTADGGFLVADSQNHRVRKIGADGRIATVAGNGINGFSGDGGAATAAQIKLPTDVSPTADGGYLIADTNNNRVRKVAADGTISTLAGTDSAGFSGDGGSASTATLNAPRAVAEAADGSVLVADASNNRVRRIVPGGNITTVVGDGSSGLTGDGGPATAARVSDPRGLAVLPDGAFVIADTNNDRVRRVGADGVITSEPLSFEADGSPALTGPTGVATDGAGRVLVSDALGHRVYSGALADAQADSGSSTSTAEPSDASSTSPSASSGPSAGGTIDASAGTTGTSPGTSGPGSGPAAEGDAELPPPAPPIAGNRLNADAVRGRVTVRVPGAGSFVDLVDAASIPVNAIVDARRGAVRLVTVPGAAGQPQAAVFSGGLFRVRQRAGRAPVTEVALEATLTCRSKSRLARRATRGKGRKSRGNRAASHARVQASRGRARGRKARAGRSRRLWGNGRGRFRTRGRNATAAVRGTVWLVEDRCDATHVRVRRGAVDVRPTAGGRATVVRAGQTVVVANGARRANRSGRR